MRVELPEPTIANHFFLDLAEGIQQQMYFWGQDVIRPEGNFLVEQGFVRSPSEGAKGTSCYRLPWQNGHIELYGACAGWYGMGRTLPCLPSVPRLAALLREGRERSVWQRLPGVEL